LLRARGGEGWEFSTFLPRLCILESFIEQNIYVDFDLETRKHKENMVKPNKSIFLSKNIRANKVAFLHSQNRVSDTVVHVSSSGVEYFWNHKKKTFD